MSNPLNSVVFEGNLVRDPELRETKNHKSVCKISIAHNRRFKVGESEVKDEVSFVDGELWGAQAKFCAGTFHKGSRIRAFGRLKQDRWSDMDGKGHSKLKIVVMHFEIPEAFNKDKAEESGVEPQRQEVVNF